MAPFSSGDAAVAAALAAALFFAASLLARRLALLSSMAFFRVSTFPLVTWSWWGRLEAAGEVKQPDSGLEGGAVKPEMRRGSIIYVF